MAAVASTGRVALLAFTALVPVALNSNCEFVGDCGLGNPQGRWLKTDLADNRRKCTLAYFHHPLFTSGKYSPGIPEVKPLWEALYDAGADVVLKFVEPQSSIRDDMRGTQ
jgi:hypothetical protein